MVATTHRRLLVLGIVDLLRRVERRFEIFEQGARLLLLTVDRQRVRVVLLDGQRVEVHLFVVRHVRRVFEMLLFDLTRERRLVLEDDVHLVRRTALIRTKHDGVLRVSVEGVGVVRLGVHELQVGATAAQTVLLTRFVLKRETLGRIKRFLQRLGQAVVLRLLRKVQTVILRILRHLRDGATCVSKRSNIHRARSVSSFASIHDGLKNIKKPPRTTSISRVMHPSLASHRLSPPSRFSRPVSSSRSPIRPSIHLVASRSPPARDGRVVSPPARVHTHPAPHASRRRVPHTRALETSSSSKQSFHRIPSSFVIFRAIIDRSRTAVFRILTLDPPRERAVIERLLERQPGGVRARHRERPQGGARGDRRRRGRLRHLFRAAMCRRSPRGTGDGCGLVDRFLVQSK